ncbi:MAG: hypothetical protein IPK19_26225 [Chloroflexi bacterium]|nr:hypothetical protein [Chloroflexota bacterium]
MSVVSSRLAGGGSAGRASGSLGAGQTLRLGVTVGRLRAARAVAGLDAPESPGLAAGGMGAQNHPAGGDGREEGSGRRRHGSLRLAGGEREQQGGET